MSSVQVRLKRSVCSRQSIGKGSCLRGRTRDLVPLAMERNGMESRISSKVNHSLSQV